MSGRDVCGWCPDRIPAAARRDALYCSTRCRQASHRFGKGRRLASPSTGVRLRLGYADPPYPGNSQRYYGEHPDFAGEVDHAALVAQLERECPDGWALSTSAAALRDVLPLCPTSARVAVWVRGERHTRSAGPQNAWEPVIYLGGRARVDAERVDVLQHVARPRLTDTRRVVGSKPAAFCYWLFDLLGAAPGDDFVDLFPGSGGVARAWSYASCGSPRRVAQLGATA